MVIFVPRPAVLMDDLVVFVPVTSVEETATAFLFHLYDDTTDVRPCLTVGRDEVFELEPGHSIAAADLARDFHAFAQVVVPVDADLWAEALETAVATQAQQARMAEARARCAVEMNRRRQAYEASKASKKQRKAA
jgi:hypothetical protein